MARDRVSGILISGPAIMLMCISACTAADEPEGEDRGADLVPIDLDRADRLHMPLVPPVRNGNLSVVGIGDAKPEYGIDGSWPASAVRCDSAGFIQMIARGEGFGAAILFAPPDSGTMATSYEVREAEDGPVTPGTARMGVQWFPEDRPYVFRGGHGTLELTRAQERLTGYLTTEFYEMSFLDSMYMAGSFAEVPIQPGTASECTLIPSDSVAGRP